MAHAHEDIPAELHQTLGERTHDNKTDLTGAPLADKPMDFGEKEKHITDSELDPTPDGEEPNEYELQHLRRIGESLPISTFMIAIVEVCERFTYYGAQGLFQNYIANHPDGRDGARGLGLGHQAATGLNLLFAWLSYITPIPGAIIADQYLGRLKTIILFAGVYWVGLMILWTTALPTAIENDASLGGFITAIIIIGCGTGGIKSNIAPLIADQYQRRTCAIRTESSGERIIIDPAITYQRIYMIFYWCVNFGALSLLATPFMERADGFWSAFLFVFCMFNVGVAVLVFCRKNYVVRPPQGSIITDAFKAVGLMIVGRTMEAAKPSWREAHGKTKPVKWTDHFIDELQRALRACKVFALYPVFWVCYNQFSNNFITQAGQMEGHGMPNDLMQNFDPISIVVLTPLLDRIVYPLLRKRGWELRPMKRITLGYIFASLSLAYAAIVQHLIYSAGPCYEHPGACPEGMDGDSPLPNHVHIAVQAPAYFFIGLAEIFISVTGLEYAYTRAPPSMKSFVQAIYLLTNAIASAIGEALVSVAVDPDFLWAYTGIACFAFATGIVNYLLFRHYDKRQDEDYALERDEPILTHDGFADGARPPAVRQD